MSGLDAFADDRRDVLDRLWRSLAVLERPARRDLWSACKALAASSRPDSRLLSPEMGGVLELLAEVAATVELDQAVLLQRADEAMEPAERAPVHRLAVALDEVRGALGDLEPVDRSAMAGCFVEAWRTVPGLPAEAARFMDALAALVGAIAVELGT